MRARVDAITDPSETTDPDYVEGLRTAISAALDYGFAAIARGEDAPPSPPPMLMTQARLAARIRVPLDRVLRRYLAGYTLLSGVIVRNAERSDSALRGDLAGLMRSQAGHFDLLITAVSRAYSEEKIVHTTAIRTGRIVMVERLLEGELLEPVELGYDLNQHHLGMIAAGPGAKASLERLARRHGCQILLARPNQGIIWVWFGSKERTDKALLTEICTNAWPPGVALAIGEPGGGLSGWRLTHRQARAAAPIAQRGSPTPVRYAEVALVTAMMQDELLAASLRHIYLDPLTAARGEGAELKDTLRAYFAAQQNVSSTAAILGVNRHTVASRLRMIEEMVGHPLSVCIAEINAVLRLEDLRQGSSLGT
ncbi:MAG TPA: helix-turn-helix domain-containing protein [Solirubrobacterales bacterium]|nr:helix-turn-helix domain-containing protein [Solirubrobacterales bacterium]